MKRTLVNLTVIQEGFKIQLIRELRRKWGEERTKPGKRIAFYEDPDGRVTIEPLD